MTAQDKQSVDRVLATLCGSTLANVEAWEPGWTFAFSNGAKVIAQTFWRTVAPDGIVVTSEDHQQLFGLPAPADAGQRTMSALRGPITKIEVTPITSDLRMSFGSEGVLEFFNTSVGYESWHLVTAEGEHKKWEMVALGGGDLFMWSPD